MRDGAAPTVDVASEWIAGNELRRPYRDVYMLSAGVEHGSTVAQDMPPTRSGGPLTLVGVGCMAVGLGVGVPKGVRVKVAVSVAVGTVGVEVEETTAVEEAVAVTSGVAVGMTEPSQYTPDIVPTNVVPPKVNRPLTVPNSRLSV